MSAEQHRLNKNHFIAHVAAENLLSYFGITLEAPGYKSPGYKSPEPGRAPAMLHPRLANRDRI
jgi:hypothetical protein